MKRHRGFTLVELLITMTVMVILLTVAIVSLRSNQVNARDEKRKTDTKVISEGLENYYEAGTDTASPGEYPSTDLMASESAVRSALRDIDGSVLRAPGVASTSAMSFTVATSTAVPAANINAYVYQPLQSNGALCNAAAQECRKFNLYYTLESNSTVQTVTSKHQ